MASNDERAQGQAIVPFVDRRATPPLRRGGHEWDWAAGRLLVAEAGGWVSEAPGVRAGAPTLVASGPLVHEALLALLRSVQTS